MSKNPVIQFTKNYDSFKTFESNREINKNHLRRLVASIEHKNLLYLFPIVVNIKREIIDGQHRLAAAKELGVDVYFLIDGSVSKADIAMVNNNRKGWSGKDYLLYYAKEGHKPYMELRSLLKYHPLSLIQAARLMEKNCITSSGGGGTTSLQLRGGNYLGGDFALAKEILNVAADLRSKIPFVYDKHFLMEIKRAVVKSNISISVISKRLDQNVDLILGSENSENLPGLLRQIILKESTPINSVLIKK
jgi:hypothetical protein